MRLVRPRPPLQLNMVGVYSKNRYEWSIVEHACNQYNMALVPLYDTLGADSASFIIGQCELKTVFASSLETPKLVKIKSDFPETVPNFTTIVQFEDVSPEDVAAAKEAGLELLSFAAVKEAGVANPAPPTPPTGDDICTVMFTSGTTGNPKGALLSHRCIVAVVSSAHLLGVSCTAEDVHLSYLPLAHVFERLMHSAMLMGGARIGFFQGDTKKLMEDLKALRPTIFPSVPRLWNRIYDKITQGAAAKGGVAATMFSNGLEAKKYWLAQGNHLHNTVWDGLVFNGIKTRLGLDRCRLFVTGSAPIADHVMQFLRCVFGVPVLEGYGQTECGGVSACTNIGDQTQLGNVGAPVPCAEIRLEAVPEMGYGITDTVHGEEKDESGKVTNPGIPCRGRGEICFRGHHIFSGYFKAPEKTAEALDADGWLHSGDIGLWTPEGFLKIIDRKKNIFKLAQGEYVAAEKIENVYAQSSFVAQVFVYGDSLKSCVVGIVVPDEEYLDTWKADKEGLKDKTFKELCADSTVKAAIEEDMKAVAAAAGLHGFEKVRGVHIHDELFSAENGLLTPTFKLKRPVARTTFKAAIDELYSGKLGDVAGQSVSQAAGAAAAK